MEVDFYEFKEFVRRPRIKKENSHLTFQIPKPIIIDDSCWFVWLGLIVYKVAWFDEAVRASEEKNRAWNKILTICWYR